MGRRRNPTEVRGVRLDPELLRIVDRLAEKNGLDFSSYIRSLIIEDFLLSGDPEAVSYAVRFLTAKAKEKVKKKVLEALDLDMEGFHVVPRSD